MTAPFEITLPTLLKGTVISTAYCVKCGSRLSNGAKFCPNCGSEIKNSNKSEFDDTSRSGSCHGDTADTSHKAPSTNEGSIMALFSYLGPLVLIPIIGASKSKFAMFHANQGLSLLLTEIIYEVLRRIILALLNILVFNMFGWIFGMGLLFSLIKLVLILPRLLFAALSIIGIVNALRKTETELPLIGKIRLLKY